MVSTKGWRKLSRTPNHREALMRNMAVQLLLHEKIKTTLPKAKELKRYIDRVITRSKKMDLAARRYISTVVTNAAVQKKIFDVIAPRYAQRSGGYSRVLKCGQRMSDGAEIGIIQLLS
ncbi:MAG: 50S ribosomal protein L17 [bacterium]